MRGKRYSKSQAKQERRITPAHAGKTTRSASRTLGGRDHPRACGENSQLFPSLRYGPGSPPRMRGKPVLGVSHNASLRITPAHAGKTSGICCPASKAEDHPRACGENEAWELIIGLPAGSPPRMRGKLKSFQIMQNHPGITPAHAGKTAQDFRALTMSWDHPRACGENARFS